jgi:hypothetical protein
MFRSWLVPAIVVSGFGCTAYHTAAVPSGTSDNPTVVGGNAVGSVEALFQVHRIEADIAGYMPHLA